VETTVRKNGLGVEPPADVILLDPAKIRLLEVNARYMPYETFSRLVQNIQNDGKLTQIPFGWVLRDDDTQEPILDEAGDPIFEVLSGNHRVKAAVAAGLDAIPLQFTDQYLTPDRRKAIQLSHNAISGVDDPTTLRLIYTSIDDVTERLYSALDDKQLALLEEATAPSLSEANLAFQTIAVVFLPDELEQAQAIWEEALKATAGNKARWIMRWRDYDDWLDGVDKISMAYNVKNVATATMLLLRLFRRHITELQDGWIEGEELKHNSPIPFDVIFGSDTVPGDVGAKLRKVVARMSSNKEIDGQMPWLALEHLADLYLNAM